MNAKDLLLNFLYIAFFVVIVGGAIVYFIQGDRFSTFAAFMRSAWPIAFLLIALAVKLRLTQSEKGRGELTGQGLRTITLSYSDKMKAEVIVFGIPLTVLIIAAFSETGVTPLGIVQAFVVFIMAYLWHKYLWLRAR